MTVLTYIAEQPALRELFEGFEEEDLNHIDLLYYAPGLDIIHKDSSADFVYIIVRGICGTFKELVNGEEFCTYKISTLDVIGLAELLSETNITRHATIRTLTNVTAFKIERSYLRQWILKYPEFYNKLILGVINRLHDNLGKHVECKMYNAHANIVSYLIYSYELYRNNYEEAYVGAVKINETREMISDFLGMSVRSINSSVEKLKNLNLIGVKRGKIYMTALQYDEMVNYKYQLLL